MKNDERRRQRSEDPYVAAALYLAAATERSRGLLAVALADEDGGLVAGAGRGDLAGLAALGSAYAGCVPDRGFPETLLEDITLGDDLYTSAIPIYGETLYLASIGARFPRQKEAAETLCRILAPALC